MPALPPAGTGPASAFGVTGTISQPVPPTILADAIDPRTGEYLSLTASANLADSFAVEALRVQRRTGAAVRELGNRFRELTHVDDESASRLDSLTREAFADGERAGVLEFLRIETGVDPSDGSTLCAFAVYRDLLAPSSAEPRRLPLYSTRRAAPLT